MLFCFSVNDDAMADERILSNDIVLIDSQAEYGSDDIVLVYSEAGPVLRKNVGPTDVRTIVIGKVVRRFTPVTVTHKYPQFAHNGGSFYLFTPV